MPSVTENKTMIVYTSSYIASSEVWVGRQVAMQKQYQPIVCCIKKTHTDLYQGERVIALKPLSRKKLRIEQVRYVLSGRGWPRSKYLRAWKLEQQIARWKAKLIHVHFLWNGVIPLQARQKSQIPIVFTAHGTDVNKARVDMEYRRYLQESVFPNATYILTGSNFLKDKLQEFGCPPEKLRNHYQGAPIPFEWRQQRDNTSGTIRIVCVALFKPVKGHTYLIAAFHKAIRQNPRLRLTLVGDGPERDELERQIAHLGLTEQVKLTGWLPPQDVQKIFHDSDMCAQMSYTFMQKDDNMVLSEEGLPVSLTEAASYGLPLLTTDSGGIREICRHGINGYLVPECDSDAMAERMLELVENQELCKQFGQKSREIAEREFDCQKQVDTLETLYNQILEKKDSSL
ncbi:MAG: glycosyltransferase family 4 protein [Candidatus Electrothrix aestuarii]|uniref:Glycosyltransferase family 4 protein n=1 Tax=Candidatus Electrothrix aestuarii TaxID=3062594 RepID=A0AAU8LY60_9BACT|nr:glycosyltransferase family 4 protein [Candidatus Electrothrix aestuarii]